MSIRNTVTENTNKMVWRKYTAHCLKGQTVPDLIIHLIVGNPQHTEHTIPEQGAVTQQE